MPVTVSRVPPTREEVPLVAGEPVLTLVGNLTDDPELRFTPSGAGVANFTVASTPRRKEGDSWVDGEALFIRCAVWRQAAENVAESLQRGMRVIVQGRLKARSYETREGAKRTVFEMDVDEVGPSLKYATAKVSKTERGQASSSFGSNDPWSSGPSTTSGPDPWATPAAAGAATEEPPF